MSYKDQWNNVDMEFMHEMIKLHNDITFERKDENEFDNFILVNKRKFDNPDYMQVFSERVELLDEYFDEHMELCQFIYDFMQTNQDWRKLDFSFRTAIRLGMFEELFKEYLEKSQ